MSTRCVWLAAGLAFGVLFVPGCARQPAVPTGLWDATVVVSNVPVPFHFEIDTQAGQPTGAFFDGDLRVPSTAGRFENGQLTLTFDQYGSRIEAALKDGRLEGRYDRGTRGPAYPFRAEPAVTRPAAEAPSIAGLWKIPLVDPQEAKTEAAWHFIVRQSGADISASILRVDGDTGTLSGSYRDGHFVLSHFSGARPLLLDVSVSPDGSLAILEDNSIRRTAVRANDPRALATEGPANPANFTRVKNPAEPFSFSFPDLVGQTVTNADPRFRGKVVIVSITGSWCPNCHDEAPLLVELYRTYRSRGLEIVALAFEEAAQLKNPARLRAFIARYGIEYPVLLAGEPAQLNEKIPQGENLVAFPTSFIVGRDGRVRAVHAGFSGPSTGAFHTDMRQALIAEIEGLLGESADGAVLAAREAGVGLGFVPLSDQAAPTPVLSSQTGGAIKSRQLDFTPSVRPAGSAATFELVLEVFPHAGMHVYAPGAKGYLTIGLTLPEPPVIAAKTPPRYPPGEDYFFKPLNEHVAVYQKPFRIISRVTLNAADAKRRAPVTIPATVTYQACDDKLCYKPEKVALAFTTPAPLR